MSNFKYMLRARMDQKGIKSIESLMERMKAAGLKVPSRKTVDKYISNPADFHDFTRGLCVALDLSPNQIDRMID